MLKSIKKRFALNITKPGKLFTQTFELDEAIKRVRGILLASDKNALLYYRGSQKIEINEQEYFPTNYESKLLMSRVKITPGIRYHNLGIIDSGNRSVKISYQDREDSRAAFVQYRLLIYLDCEMEVG